jgi:DNA replication protein DnaC
MTQKALLEEYLGQLKLPTFVQNYEQYAQDASRGDSTHEQYLLALCEAEIAQRKVNRIERAISAARFPILKELSGFDFSQVGGVSKGRVLTLAQGGYIEQRETIILMGNPGLGKTHIATGLGMAAWRLGRRVRFYSAAGLVNELLVAQKELRRTSVLGQLRKLEVLILDEVGFIPFTKDGSHLLFQMCSELYEKVSIIITTNLRFADWNSVFGDERMTAALLDRLTHRAHLLEFVGESYRFRERLQKDEQGAGSMEYGA